MNSTQCVCQLHWLSHCHPVSWRANQFVGVVVDLASYDVEFLCSKIVQEWSLSEDSQNKLYNLSRWIEQQLKAAQVAFANQALAQNKAMLGPCRP